MHHEAVVAPRVKLGEVHGRPALCLGRLHVDNARPRVGHNLGEVMCWNRLFHQRRTAAQRGLGGVRPERDAIIAAPFAPRCAQRAHAAESRN